MVNHVLWVAVDGSIRDSAVVQFVQSTAAGVVETILFVGVQANLLNIIHMGAGGVLKEQDNKAFETKSAMHSGREGAADVSCQCESSDVRLEL